eukprot:2087272-Pleurochrysis_carterae.AAC.3
MDGSAWLWFGGLGLAGFCAAAALLAAARPGMLVESVVAPFCKLVVSTEALEAEDPTESKAASAFKIQLVAFVQRETATIFRQASRGARLGKELRKRNGGFWTKLECLSTWEPHAHQHVVRAVGRNGAARLASASGGARRCGAARGRGRSQSAGRAAIGRQGVAIANSTTDIHTHFESGRYSGSWCIIDEQQPQIVRSTRNCHVLMTRMLTQ